MDRRRFLFTSTTAAVGALGFRSCFAESSDTPATAAEPTIAELTINMDSASHQMPPNYSGFSYELAQLTNPNFFSGANKELIGLFRQLTPSGVLRLGGNTSEQCWFKADAETEAPKLVAAEGPATDNWMPKRQFMIVPEAIDHLAEFSKASGWQVIYGVSLGNSSPDRAAKEAEYVAKTLGEGLYYFQIGNEPDFYHNPNNRVRPANWGFNDYVKEWLEMADAISAKVPNARFGGPDVGASSNWVNQFIAAAGPKLGDRLAAVTGHYYAEGPPDDPKVTTERLLRTNPALYARTKAICDAAAKDHLVYRMTEGNSCYRGGKPGMSNAFASALWAGDYMLMLASAGCAGVNLHGGSREFLRASLGDHMPGENVSKEGSSTKGGYYTPIDGEVDVGFSARPILYGMFTANQLAGSNTRTVSLKNTGGADVTAYAGEKDGQLLVAIFNKDETHDAKILLKPVEGYQHAELWRLTAPALDATSDVRLAGSELTSSGSWKPEKVEAPASNNDGTLVEFPHASAGLVLLKR
jgi:hypothetical protein